VRISDKTSFWWVSIDENDNRDAWDDDDDDDN
jgi:hypothetical protein